MESKVCSFFGHRKIEITIKLKDKVKEVNDIKTALGVNLMLILFLYEFNYVFLFVGWQRLY